MATSYDEMIAKKKSVSSSTTTSTSAWDAMQDPNADKDSVRAQLSTSKANPIVGKTVTANDIRYSKSTPLMTALSTNKTSGVAVNEGTNYKPIAVPTSAQKMAQVGIEFKPTTQSQINTVNGISNKTITPTPMVQDKQTDTDVERGFYALGNAISPNKANTVGGGLRYDLARGVTGAVGAVEGVTDFVVGGLNNVGSTVASLGGTKPNAVSQFFDSGAQYVYDNDAAGAMRKGIEDKVGNNKDWSSNITGELWDMAGNIIAASGTGKAASELAKVSAPILSKAAFGASQGGNSAQQAYNEGATSMQAAGYGNVIAAATVATESMFGGVPTFGKGVLDDIIKGLNKSPKAMQALVDMVGEGGEEAVQTYITPYLQRIYYNPEAKNATIDEMLTSFAYGAGLSGIMQAPSVIGSIGAKPSVSSSNTQYTAQTGANNVQKQTLTPNLNANIPNVNVQNNVSVPNTVQNAGQITPNIVKPTQNTPQRAAQAPTSDFTPQVATDTAKAVEANTVQQVKPEATKPTEFYTGSSNPNITEFKPGGDGNTKQSGDSFGVGVYLTDNPDVAKLYAQGDNGKVYKVSTDSNLLNLEDKASPEYAKTVAESIADAPKQYRNRILRDVGRVKKSFTDAEAAEAFFDKANDEWESEDGQYSGNKPTVDKQGDSFVIEYTDYGSDLQSLLSQSTNRKLFEAIASINTNDASSLVTAAGYDGITYHDGGAFNSGIEGNTAVIYRNTHRIKQVNESTETKSPSLFPSNSLGAKITNGMPQGTGAASNPYESNQKVSEVYTNTLKNTDEISDTAKAQLNEKDFTFDSVGEKQSKGIADQRTDFDYDGEVAELKSDSAFTAAEDVDTAFNILERVAKESDESGNGEELNAIAKQIYKKSHQNAVALQAMDKHSRTPATAVVDAHRVVSQIADEMTTKKELGKPVDTALGRQVKTESTQIENVVKTEGKQSANDVVEEIAQSVKKQGKKSEGKKPANLNPLAEKTDAEKAAEKLAGKVAATTKERKPIEVNAINDMVNELFKSAKESPLPEQSPRPKRSPIEFLTQAIKNKSEYADVWNNAKEILLEKYADNPEVLDMLNDYFNKGIVPTYSDATLTSSVKQMLKDLGIKLSQMKELTWENRQRVIKSLTNYLVEQTGAVDGDAKMLKRDAADKITKLIIDSAPTLTKKQKLEIKQATQDAMRKHGVPVESWADETGRLIAEGISKKFAPPEAPKPNAMTSVISDDIKKFVGKLPAQIKPVIGRNAIDRYTDFMENRQYYTEAWAKLQSELKVKYANNPEALKAIDTIINRNAETAATDYYNKELDGMINKALKSINVKLSELVAQGKGNHEAVVKAVTDILINEHGIDGDAAKTISENVATRFNEMLKERAIQKIANIIKAKSSVKTKQSERQRMNALMNLGSFDMDSLADLIKAKYDVPTLTAADAQKIYEFNKLAQEAKNDYQKRVFENRAAKIIADKLPIKGKDKVLAVRRIAMLLNPKTLISRNAGGNVIFGLLLEDIKDAPGTVVDILTTKIAKTDWRTTSYNPLATAKAEFLGAKKGLTEWGKDIKNNVDTSPTQHEMPQAPALKSKVGAAFESALNKILQVGDRPFYEAAKAKRLDELKRLGMDYTSEDAIAQANVYALERVFQNNSDLAKKAMEMRDSLGVIGDIAMPFAQAPANMFDKLADYSPYGFVRAIKKAGTIKDSAWSQKQFVDTLARSMTGTGIIAFAFFAAKSGLITGGDNEEEDEALTYQKKISGWQPYSIIVGDKSYTYDWATVVGALLSLGADISQSENAGDTLLAILSNGAKAGINTMFNQSYMEGVAELFGSSTNGKADIGKGLESMLVSLPASFTPTAFQQIAKIIDPIARDTYDTDPLKKAWNKVKAKLPFLSQTLPAKISASGQESTNYQGGKLSNILESTLSPGFIGETQKTAIDTEVQRLYKATGDKSVLPDWSEYTSKSDLSFTVSGKDYTMTTKEWEQYQKTRGQYAYKELNKLTQSADYKSMSDAEKAKAVSSVVAYSNDMAKREFVGSSYVSSNYEKVYEADKQGISPSNYFTYKAILGTIDTDGSPTQLEKTQAIEQMDMSVKLKGAMWQLQNSTSGAEKNPYTGTLAQAGLAPEKTIAIMAAFDKIDKAIDDNYVKPEGGAGAAQVKAAYLNQWLASQGYNSAQITYITDVFTTWQMIPIDKPSSKATAFATANPMPQ